MRTLSQKVGCPPFPSIRRVEPVLRPSALILRQVHYMQTNGPCLRSAGYEHQWILVAYDLRNELLDIDLADHIRGCRVARSLARMSQLEFIQKRNFGVCFTVVVLTYSPPA